MTAILLVGLVVIPTVTAARPSYAIDLACQVTGDYNNIGPDSPGGGVEGMLPRVAMWDKNPGYVVDGNVPNNEVLSPAKNYTMWELNGTSGLDWSTSGKDVDGNDSCSVWNVTASQVAQIIFEVPRFMVSITNSLQEMATSKTPVAPLLDRLDGSDGNGKGVVTQMYQYLTIPGIVIALIATGFWIVAKSGRRRDDSRTRERELVDGAVWAIGAAAVVIFLLAGNFWRTYLDAGDKALGEFNSAVNSALLPGVGATGPCALPDGAPNRGQRVAICNFYKTFAFDPWARGQFGSAGGHRIVTHCLGDDSLSEKEQAAVYKSYLGSGASDIRLFQVEAQSYNLNDWRLLQASKDKDARDANTKYPPSSNSSNYSPWGDVRKHLQANFSCAGGFSKYSGKYPDDADRELSVYYSDWSGANGFARIGIALSNALLTILCAIVPLLASMLAFMFQVLAWLTIFALPLAGVAGIFPPLRSWLTSLLSTLVASYIARFAFGVVLTMTQLAYSMVFSSPFPFGVQILILLVVVFTAVHLIRAVREASLTSAWGRAVHHGTTRMAGTARQQSGMAVGAGRTVLAGAAGGAAAMVLDENSERRRRNTVDRPMGRDTTTAARTTSRTTATGAPATGAVATGAVIRSDGRLTRPGAQPPPTEPAVRPDAPEVARRARRREEEQPEPRQPGEEPAGHQPRHRDDEPAPPRQEERRPADDQRRPTDDDRPARRQDRTVVREVVRTGGREPETREEPQEPTVTSGPAPENRRQGQRADFIDPEP